MSVFLTSPYDDPLDLVDKDDRKLFKEEFKGLCNKDMFTGTKQGYVNFVKLIKTEFESTRTMEALEVCTKWDTAEGTDEAKRIPSEQGKIDIFTSNKASKEEVIFHCDLVWSTSAFGSNTPKYFKNVASAPANNATLNDAWNLVKQKYIIIGTKIWNSLSSELKVEISCSKQEIKKDQEYVGPLL